MSLKNLERALALDDLADAASGLRLSSTSNRLLSEGVPPNPWTTVLRLLILQLLRLKMTMNLRKPRLAAKAAAAAQLEVGNEVSTLHMALLVAAAELVLCLADHGVQAPLVASTLTAAMTRWFRGPALVVQSG
jgi:hypothetical protein